MILTGRLQVYPMTDHEMRALITDEQDDGLRQAYGEMLALSEAHPEERQWYAAWTIERKDGVRIGDLCFKGLTDDGRVEIGYGLLPEYQGQGYATEAVIATVEWALSQLSVTAVEAETDPNNIASQKVLKKAGFLPTGIIGEEGPRFILRR